MSKRLTNFRGIVRSTENKFGRAVVAGTDVRDVGLIGNEDLGTSEIAELENTAVGV